MSGVLFFFLFGVFLFFATSFPAVAFGVGLLLSDPEAFLFWVPLVLLFLRTTMLASESELSTSISIAVSAAEL